MYLFPPNKVWIVYDITNWFISSWLHKPSVTLICIGLFHITKFDVIAQRILRKNCVIIAWVRRKRHALNPMAQYKAYSHVWHNNLALIVLRGIDVNGWSCRPLSTQKGGSATRHYIPFLISTRPLTCYFRYSKDNNLRIGASESQELCLRHRSSAESIISAFWFALLLLLFLPQPI